MGSGHEAHWLVSPQRTSSFGVGKRLEWICWMSVTVGFIYSATFVTLKRTCVALCDGRVDAYQSLSGISLGYRRKLVQ